MIRIGMLPAGFEPASEARKAPILNRTRLRERKAGLVPGSINAFGKRAPRAMQNRKLLGRTVLRQPGMRRGKPTLTELSFFVCGFLVIVVGWLADLLGVFELNTVTGGHAAGTLQLRIFLTMFGVAFATIGVAYDNFPEILSDGEMAKRYLISFLFLADGSLHLYALNDHLGEAFPAAFFGVFS